MKKSGWIGTAGLAAMLAVAVGCGGGGGGDSALSGGGQSGGGPAPAPQESGTARIDVNTETGEVKITPLGMAPGQNDSRSLYTGSAVSVTSAHVFTDPGEITLKTLQLSIRNNTADPLTNAWLVVDRVATSADAFDLREFSNVSTIVGPGGSANDGPGPTVTISQPTGIARDTDGTLYLAGSGDGTLRKLKDNYVTRIATGLATPGGVALTGGFAFMVEQSLHNLVRVPTSGGNKFTMAGGGAAGLVDGAGTTARFSSPRDIQIIGSTAYIADYGNNRIRTATNLSGGSANVGTLNVFPVITGPSGLAHLNLAGVDWLVVASSATHKIFLVNSSNGQSFQIAGTGVAGSADGSGTTAAFNSPFDAAVSGGAIMVSDLGGRTIRQLALKEGAQPQFAASWDVKTVAGDGTSGTTDGSGLVARFASPRFMAADASGAILISDLTNNRTRKMTAASGVFPITGIDTNGGGGTVSPANPDGFLPDPQTTTGRKPYYVLNDMGPRDGGIDTVEKSITFNVQSTVRSFSFVVSLTASGTTPTALDAVLNTGSPFLGSPNVNVRTIAGRAQTGYVNGSAAIAQFSAEPFMAASSVGIFVADFTNSSIRLIDNENRVSTIAGIKGVTGGTLSGGSGETCSFQAPTNIWSNADGTELYLVDFGAHGVVRMSRPSYLDPALPASWAVAVIAGNTGSGNTVGDGLTAKFVSPLGIVAEPDGQTVYVSDSSNNCIKRMKFQGSNQNSPSHWSVDYYLGATDGSTGDADGSGTAARFRRPSGLSLGLNGELFIAEISAHRVRRADVQGTVSLLAGSSLAEPGALDGVGSAARFSSPRHVVTDNAGYVYVGSGGMIRRINLATAEVRTVAGSNTNGTVDGPGDVARFSDIHDLAYVPGRGLYFSTMGRIGIVERVLRTGKP